MWESVELREFRTFVVVADELHFARAAARLQVSPSRVSQLLRRLEDGLGTRLVDRTSRRVALTDAGRALLDELTPALAGLDGVLGRAYAGDAGLRGTLRLGVISPPTGGRHLKQILTAFETRHPGCRVEVVDVSIRSGLVPLLAGALDVAAVRLPLDEPRIVLGPILSEEPRVLLVSCGHPLAGSAAVTLEELAGERVARLPGLPPETEAAILPEQTPSGVPIARHPREPESIHALLALVARGEVVHLTSAGLLDYVRHPDVVAVPLTGMPRSRTALAWPTSSIDARRDAFVAVAEQVLSGTDELPAGVALDQGQDPAGHLG